MSTDAQPNDSQPFDDTPIIERLGPVELSLYTQPATLRLLLKLKHERTKGRGLRKVDSNASINDPQRNLDSRNQFAKALGEINTQVDRALMDVKAFLDLGCAPGGFSTWILKNNGGCRGVGVTIGDDHNGWEMNQLGWEDVVGCYAFLKGDITDATFWPKIEEEVQAIGGCDLIIAGAVFRELESPERDPEGTPEPNSGRTLLQVSQVVLGLRMLQEGGNMLLVMWSKPFPLTLTLLLLLKKTFNRVTTTKGMTLHRKRPSFYLFCENRNADISNALKKMEAALDEGLPNARDARWLRLLGEDKTGLTSEEEREVLDILEPLWQKEADVEVERQEQRKFPRRRGSKRGRGRPSGLRRSSSYPQLGPLA